MQHSWPCCDPVDQPHVWVQKRLFGWLFCDTLVQCCSCSMRGRFEAEIRKAQDAICAAVENMDGGKFHEDAWTRPGGGGGISRVLQVSKLPFTSTQIT